MLLFFQPQPKERGQNESIQVAAFLAIIGGIAGLAVSTLGIVYFDFGLVEALSIYCASGLSVFGLGITLLIFHGSRHETATGFDGAPFSYATEANKS